MDLSKIEITDKDVKVIYVTDVEGDYKLSVGQATLFANGMALITPSDGTQDVTRENGKYLLYLEFGKVSSLLYNRAVKLAKEKADAKK